MKTSKGVLDRIFDLQHKGFKINCLIGNHEQLLLNNYFNYDPNNPFPDAACLRSFKVRYVHHIPEKYITFFQSLPLYITTEKYILVHAGLNFKAQDRYAELTQTCTFAVCFLLRSVFRDASLNGLDTPQALLPCNSRTVFFAVRILREPRFVSQP